MDWLLSGTENKCIRPKKNTKTAAENTEKTLKKPKNLPISLSLVCSLKSRSPNKPYAISIIIDFGWGIRSTGSSCWALRATWTPNYCMPFFYLFKSFEINIFIEIILPVSPTNIGTAYPYLSFSTNVHPKLLREV